MKKNFLTQLILEMKLTHYLVPFWTCPYMPCNEAPGNLQVRHVRAAM